PPRALVDETMDALAHAEGAAAEGQHLAVEPHALVPPFRGQGGRDLFAALHLDELAGLEVEGRIDDRRGPRAGQVDFRDQAELAHRLLDRGPGGDAQEAAERDVAGGVLTDVRTRVPEPEVLRGRGQLGVLTGPADLRTPAGLHRELHVMAGALEERAKVGRGEGRSGG